VLITFTMFNWSLLVLVVMVAAVGYSFHLERQLIAQRCAPVSEEHFTGPIGPLPVHHYMMHPVNRPEADQHLTLWCDMAAIRSASLRGVFIHIWQLMNEETPMCQVEYRAHQILVQLYSLQQIRSVADVVEEHFGGLESLQWSVFERVAGDKIEYSQATPLVLGDLWVDLLNQAVTTKVLPILYDDMVKAGLLPLK
jgi:hypothetical protein